MTQTTTAIEVTSEAMLDEQIEELRGLEELLGDDPAHSSRAIRLAEELSEGYGDDFGECEAFDAWLNLQLNVDYSLDHDDLATVFVLVSRDPDIEVTAIVSDDDYINVSGSWSADQVDRWVYAPAVARNLWSYGITMVECS